MNVFVNTGGWLSLLIESDRYHPEGNRYFQECLKQKTRFLTSDYVLDEVITRLSYDVGHSIATRFIKLIHEAESNKILTSLTVTLQARRRAEVIFSQYKDVKLSFTDCTSFALLELHTAQEVFGFDAHFEMMGHILKPKD